MCDFILALFINLTIKQVAGLYFGLLNMEACFFLFPQVFATMDLKHVKLFKIVKHE